MCVLTVSLYRLQLANNVVVLLLFFLLFLFILLLRLLATFYFKSFILIVCFILENILALILPVTGSLLHVPHTHTHTHIHIYIYIFTTTATMWVPQRNYSTALAANTRFLLTFSLQLLPLHSCSAFCFMLVAGLVNILVETV